MNKSRGLVYAAIMKFPATCSMYGNVWKIHNAIGVKIGHTSTPLEERFKKLSKEYKE